MLDAAAYYSRMLLHPLFATLNKKVLHDMAQLSIAAAARAAGKDRGTINRYIKSGRLSAVKNAAGQTVIETSELLRVFGELQTGGGKNSKKAAVKGAVETTENNSGIQHVLESTLELLKQQLKASQDREDKLLAMLGQEQESRRELERRLLPPGDVVVDRTSDSEENLARNADTLDAEGVIIIPPQRNSTLEAAELKKEKKGFLAVLFGK